MHPDRALAHSVTEAYPRIIPAVLARGALLTCELSTRTWTLRPALSQADLAIEL